MGGASADLSPPASPSGWPQPGVSFRSPLSPPLAAGGGSGSDGGSCRATGIGWRPAAAGAGGSGPVWWASLDAMDLLLTQATPTAGTLPAGTPPAAPAPAPAQASGILSAGRADRGKGVTGGEVGGNRDGPVRGSPSRLLPGPEGCDCRQKGPPAATP